MTLYRRTLLQAGAAVLAAPAIVRADSARSFKVGAVVPMTTGQAIEGKSHLDGFKLFLDQTSWTPGGRKIELVVADDEMKPPVGLQKTRRLVENDKVDCIIGPVSSGVALAMADYLKQSGTMWICSGAGVAGLTREKRAPYLFRTSCSTWQTNHPMGEWAPDHLGRTAILMASDYSGGRDTMAEFRQPFVAKGGSVAREIYPPLGTKDFSAYFADLKAQKADFLYAFFTGADSIAFVQQYEQFGLKQVLPLSGPGFLTDPELLDAMGPAALGVTTCLHYSSALDTEVNKRFVAGFKAATGRRPSFSSEYGYVVAQVLAAALEKGGGNFADNDRFAEALIGVNLEAPRGPFRFDPVTHNVVNSAYILKVEQRNGVIDNQVLQTYRDVTDPGVNG